MKLYHYSAYFCVEDRDDKELDSDDLLECRAWIVRQLSKNNAPEAMGIYDNRADKEIFLEVNKPIIEE